MHSWGRPSCPVRLTSPALLLAQDTRRAYRELLYTAPIGEAGVSGAIMFKETLYQSAADGTSFVDVLSRQGVLSGIKVDEVRARGQGEQH